MGETAEWAAESAAIVVEIETDLARASLSRVDRRDPHKVYHRMNLAALQKLTPAFSWKAYFGAAGVAADGPGFVVDVTEPEFLKAVETVLAKRPRRLLAHLSEVGAAARRGCGSVRALPRSRLRFLFEDAARSAGAAAALAGVRGWGRPRPRRGTRQALRRQGLHAGNAGSGGARGPWRPRGHGGAPAGARLDERPDAHASAREAHSDARQDRLSGGLARLLGPEDQPAPTTSATSAGRPSSRTGGRSPGSASRSIAASGT